MSTATAHLKNLRQSPRKVRLVAELVKGRPAAEAVRILEFTPKRAAKPLQKLLLSAQANARDKKLGGDLRLASIQVDEGRTLFRARPAAMGRSRPIRKRTSHIRVVLTELELSRSEAKNSKPDPKVKK